MSARTATRTSSLTFCLWLGHKYNLYPAPEHPSIDAFNHLKNWKWWYENYVQPGHSIVLDNPIFPQFLMATHTVNVGIPMSSENTQKLINAFTSGANLNRGDVCLYTTHTFRRGGAQYRFMYAPAGTRWTLSRIRWWGGWADGESVRPLLLPGCDSNHTHHVCP